MPAGKAEDRRKRLARRRSSKGGFTRKAPGEKEERLAREYRRRKNIPDTFMSHGEYKRQKARRERRKKEERRAKEKGGK